MHLRQGRYEEARKSAEWFAQTFGQRRLLARDPAARHRRGAGRHRGHAPAGRRSSGSAWSPPTTRTTSGGRTPRRTTCCWPSAPAATWTTPSGSASPAQESYVKSEKEMRALFPDHPETLANTAAGRRPLRVRFREAVLPARASPAPPSTPSDEALLEHLARAGRRAALRRRRCRRAVAERLAYELGVINTRGLRRLLPDRPGLHRRRARARHSGRARAAARPPARSSPTRSASPTSDPLKFDLLFERFLNPERVSMPDIDVDFCFERRGEVIEYVRERYGRDSVGPDRHLRHHEGARRGEGRGPGAPDSAGRGRPDHQADPLGPGLQPHHPRGREEGGRAAGAGEGQPGRTSGWWTSARGSRASPGTCRCTRPAW